VAITIKKDGYAQVEPNHVSAPRDGRVYAQLPAADDIEVLEQGTFVKYDYAKGEVNFTGAGPWFMVYNEEKLYDERYQMHKHFAMKKEEAQGGIMTPRVFGIVAGDIFTTNAVVEGEYELGDQVAPGADGILAPLGEGAEADLVFEVCKLYTMPDGQPGIKLRCIQAR
jgi:hypothetical protein